jgi:predicted O-methyltransferase YrrM
MNRIILLTLVFAMFASGLGAAEPVFEIPPVDRILIDGEAEDWGDRGFRVELLPDPDGRFLPANDFDARFRLGWNKGGLFILVEVSDDVAHEHEELSRLWQEDCVELFLADGRGSGNLVQIVLAPGADDRFDSLRVKLYDHGGGQREVSPVQASRLTGSGYVLEIFFPADSMGIACTMGTEFAFQLIANDSDGPGGGSFRTAWYPAIGAHEDTKLMHTVRMASSPSPPVTLHAARRSVLKGCEVILTAAMEELGNPVTVTAGSREIEGTVIQRDGRAGGVTVIDAITDRGMCPPVTVSVSGRDIASFAPIMSLRRILGKYVDAMGGRRLMDKTTSRRCRCSSATEPLKHHGDKGRTEGPTYFEVTVDASGRWLYKNLSSDPPVLRGFDGSEGWVSDENGVRREDLSGWGVTVWWIDPRGPLRIDRYFSGLEVVEEESDSEYHIVRGNLPNGRQLRLLFDRDTGLLEQAGRLHFDDYGKVDGINVARLVYFDTRYSRTRFRMQEIENGVEIEKGTFDMPDPAERFPDVYSGITDPKVLPMLKRLPTVHGGMNVPAADGRFLYDLIIEKGYRRGLEIGTSNGYSTLWMGLAFRETGGRIITIEYEKLRGEEAAENFGKAGLGDVIDLRINDAFDEIPKIDGKFDFIFLDAWKPDYIRFLELIRDRVIPGGAIAAHNVIAQERSMRDFLEAIENDPGLETTFIEASSEGISLSIVKK